MITPCNYLLQKKINKCQQLILGRGCRDFSVLTPNNQYTASSSSKSTSNNNKNDDDDDDDGDIDGDSSYCSNNRVTTTIDGSTGICRVQLNRPNKLNSLDLKMFYDIAETVSSLKNDKLIRAVILSGNGLAFCTGLDIKAVLKGGNPQKQIQKLLKRRSRSSNDVNDELVIESNLAQDVSILWRELNVPVIAVLHGMCYGAGLQIALGADFRFATPDCKLSIMEGKWGLIPDMGASILLKELVRIDVAKELTMTGRIISGTEANELGLVTRVCETPMIEAETFALELAERSPDAVAAAKQLFQKTWSAVSDNDSLRLESILQKKLLITWNQLAASGRSALGWGFPYFKRK